MKNHEANSNDLDLRLLIAQLPRSSFEDLLPPGPVLTSSEIADVVRVGVRTVRNWAEMELLHGIKIGKRLWRFRRDDVVYFLRLQQAADEQDC